MQATIGDHIVVDGHQPAGGHRHGIVREVFEEGGDEHYRVCWDDGHESIFFPGPDAHVESRA
jgi:hypothetical protein